MLELKEKLGAEDPVPISSAAGTSPHVTARDALVELGYSVVEAEQALAPIDSGAAGRGARAAGAEAGGMTGVGSTEPAQGAEVPALPARSGTVSAVAAEVLGPEEEELERSLRPRKLDEFVGQEGVKEQLAIALAAAKARGEALDHVLLVGPPGLGKTTLAQIIREELGVGIRTVAGPALERKGDMAAILTEPRGPRRALRRRDPPDQPLDRGDPLSGARGLPARHHRRSGAGRDGR